MSSLMDSELSASWGFENLVMFGSKLSGNPKKLQPEDWVFGDTDEMNAVSFNLSGVRCGSGGSGSEFGNGSSGKSSISASANSSPQNGMKSSGFAFEDLRGPLPFGHFTDQVGEEISGASPLLEPSNVSVEPTTDLKLGKRACLENSWSGGIEKSPSSVISTPSATTTKKTKPPSLGGSLIPLCQVEGCNLDLSSAKDYHRKHRVCDGHSKSLKVTVKGVERRFCQQCSRFHGLTEFDQKKRSCRRRLSDHNARRRRPQQETIAFNSSRLPSSFYDGTKQMTFLPNTRAQTRNAARDWESTYESKFTITKGYTSKYGNSGLVPGQPQIAGSQVSEAIRIPGNPSNGFLAPKSTAASRVLIPQGFKDVTSATVSVGAAPDFHRALSLLSTNSWGSSEAVSFPFDNTMHTSRINMPRPLTHAFPQSSLPSSEYWLYGQPPTYSRVHSLTTSSSGIGHNEGFQLPKTSYGTDFHLSPLLD